MLEGEVGLCLLDLSKLLSVTTWVLLIGRNSNLVTGWLKNDRPTWCHLLFYFTSYVLNMFRTLIYPSSGACDCVDFDHSFCRLKPAKRTPPKTSHIKSSNTQRTENKMTYVVIQQHSRKLLMMDILMSETCWAHKKWYKVASDIKMVF